jgi:hypothetical protein
VLEVLLQAPGTTVALDAARVDRTRAHNASRVPSCAPRPGHPLQQETAVVQLSLTRKAEAVALSKQTRRMGEHGDDRRSGRRWTTRRTSEAGVQRKSPEHRCASVYLESGVNETSLLEKRRDPRGRIAHENKVRRRGEQRSNTRRTRTRIEGAPQAVQDNDTVSVREFESMAMRRRCGRREKAKCVPLLYIPSIPHTAAHSLQKLATAPKALPVPCIILPSAVPQSFRPVERTRVPPCSLPSSSKCGASLAGGLPGELTPEFEGAADGS